jgi:hypothetical protein
MNDLLDNKEPTVSAHDLAREHTRRWRDAGEMIAAVAFSAMALGGLHYHVEYAGWLIFLSVIIVWRRVA